MYVNDKTFEGANFHDFLSLQEKILWFASENKLLSASCGVIKKHHLDLQIVGCFNEV